MLDDKFGTLFVIASMHAVKDVSLVHGYYIVVFEGTTATLAFDSKDTIREEIQNVIADARS